MPSNFDYNKIIKYSVLATCTEPLHIGSTEGEAGEILVHPVDDLPFIQASGISGVFRDYYTRANTKEQAEKLFGSSRQSDEDGGSGSRIRFTDGTFPKENAGVKVELRPRVAINPESGSVAKEKDGEAGHKFETEYIGAGAKFEFCVYLYDDSFREALEDVFAATNSGAVQFGGQKSNGCGYVRIDGLKRKVFDMTDEEDRRLWAGEDTLEDRFYEDCLSTLKKGSYLANAYDICVTGRTEGTLLVRSAVVGEGRKDGEEIPDSENMRNANKDYIIPGSSLKGAVRNQMEKIVSYLKQKGVCTGDLIKEAFGSTGSKDSDGMSGNLRFHDAVVGKKGENKKYIESQAPQDAPKASNTVFSHRIHIDKFTGGVMYGALFSERSVSGQVCLRISVLDKNNPDRTCGVLLMALRDLAIGAMNLGSGYNVGRGFIDVDKISISRHREGTVQADIDMRSGTVNDPDGIIQNCLKRATKGRN